MHRLLAVASLLVVLVACGGGSGPAAATLSTDTESPSTKPAVDYVTCSRFTTVDGQQSCKSLNQKLNFLVNFALDYDPILAQRVDLSNHVADMAKRMEDTCFEPLLVPDTTITGLRQDNDGSVKNGPITFFAARAQALQANSNSMMITILAIGMGQQLTKELAANFSALMSEVKIQRGGIQEFMRWSNVQDKSLTAKEIELRGELAFWEELGQEFDTPHSPKSNLLNLQARISAVARARAYLHDLDTLCGVVRYDVVSYRTEGFSAELVGMWIGATQQRLDSLASKYPLLLQATMHSKSN